MDLLTIIGGALVGLVSLVAALVFNRRKGRSEGRSEAQTEALKDAVDRTEQGRVAVRDGRFSGDTPDQRLRKNDGQW